MKVYIIGPMRGRQFYNFPAFDAARDMLVQQGHEVRSPADMDREVGFDAMNCDPDDSCDGVPAGFDFMACVRRDIEAVIWCDAVWLLPGFLGSRGCRAELTLARWLGKPVLKDPEAFDEAWWPVVA